MIGRYQWRRRAASCAAALILLQCAFAAATQAADPYGLSGRVLRVLGPNRLVVEGPGGAQYQVLLRGTEPGATTHPATRDAETRLVETLVGRHVSITDVAGGTSSATVFGVVRLGHEDINYQWLRDGMLRFDGSTADASAIDAYAAAEDAARAAGIGIWAEEHLDAPPSTPAVPATPPPGGWQFRPLRSGQGR